MLDIDDDDSLLGYVPLSINLKLWVHVSLGIVGFLNHDIDDIGIAY